VIYTLSKARSMLKEGLCCFIIVDRIVKAASELQQCACFRRLTFRELTEEAHLDTLNV
jgi:hypothetical protein